MHACFSGGRPANFVNANVEPFSNALGAKDRVGTPRPKLLPLENQEAVTDYRRQVRLPPDHHHQQCQRRVDPVSRPRRDPARGAGLPPASTGPKKVLISGRDNCKVAVLACFYIFATALYTTTGNNGGVTAVR